MQNTIFRQLAARLRPRALPTHAFAAGSPAICAVRRISSSPLAGPRAYKTKKVWPPDFNLLSPQEQLRFEKRFKRRMALRAERPRWIKFVKLAQLFTITTVLIYCVLFMEWDRGPTPFDDLRAWFWDVLGTRQGGALQRGKDSDSRSSGAAAEPRTETK
ncbi:hypothetical protein CMQ_6798 [Grosmannia clavigera kw1407]|uniref:Transmembrane protein n=1 Tax=Grosmannia clavigera (strain kw1407 / UAMH 11150) TaxID=655863 RepID=F0X6T9_GROCL|nr:uncharacterized protein CMQ_6798 [Grosmannia clavigera kw1407]EFX06477.1 hypothetical protein CMQ_6798 [Grosmannia clavigera kw1407]